MIKYILFYTFVSAWITSALFAESIATAIIK